mmetsp:Transcript_12514/g.43534  ORF Transcript_12514/g.43534 Transcript_12514/m.43534 type:complete len:213 (-) Transcript_12514:870-1508(-)
MHPQPLEIMDLQRTEHDAGLRRQLRQRNELVLHLVYDVEPNLFQGHGLDKLCRINQARQRDHDGAAVLVFPCLQQRVKSTNSLVAGELLWFQPSHYLLSDIVDVVLGTPVKHLYHSICCGLRVLLEPYEEPKQQSVLPVLWHALAIHGHSLVGDDLTYLVDRLLACHPVLPCSGQQVFQLEVNSMILVRNQRVGIRHVGFVQYLLLVSATSG